MGNVGDRTAKGTLLMPRTPVNGTIVPSDPPSAFDATVVDDERNWDSKVPSAFAPTHTAADSNVTLTSPAQSSPFRTTVLPKPKAGGVRPELVHSDRPRYQRERLLGEGGVGEVVRSIDNDIERTVAIKRLKTDMRAASHVARFVDEIRTVGSMEHPNIVPIHDVGIDEEGQYFFVMKYVDGETLEAILDRLRQGDRRAHVEYGYERRVEIFVGVLEAVAYAHAKGIIHRDIKPANVMVGRYGEVTLMDWGIARSKNKDDPAPAFVDADTADSSTPASAHQKDVFRTQVGTLIGTPAYMSPEQARAEALDERSDVYSLSVLFHEMLCLTHYLQSATTLEQLLAGVGTVKAPFAAVATHPHQSSVPAELAHFVDKGLAKDPKDRYQTVQAMIDRLRDRAAGEFPIQCPTTFTKRATSGWVHFVDRHPFLGPAVFILMILGFFGAVGSLVIRTVG